MLLRATLVLGLTLFSPFSSIEEDTSSYSLALSAAERHLESGNYSKAHELLVRVLERDKKAIPAWDLRARLAEAAGNRDERIYSLHQKYRLSISQGVKRGEVAAQRAALEELDPVAGDLISMKTDFIGKLQPIADKYEKQGRPHSAIRVFKQILALDAENAEALAAIERIASAPDPSLAADAKPKDLFEDVSDEWIREHDEEHAEWKKRAKLERENYTTYTDAGYEVLVRAGEAMEQMNLFYRQFFRYGTEEDGKSVPKIGLNIFKNREEYLELGIGPPVEWSAGHFTGSYVETYIGTGGFEGMTGTLFHEAAHQFVSLATTAAGWLNEGLASFFEGTRILPNGTVIMNMPASHRLFPLAERMEQGWMESEDDGISKDDPNTTPSKAPTFRIVLEDRYSWGPPWYAPTWGVVYFLYNYQDQVDGRFVYRRAFQEFLNKSGGRSGDGAVRNFEEVVLANPSKPLKGVEGGGQVRLPKTVAELDEVWKQWCLDLRDELSGTLEVERPYLAWGQFAAANKQYIVAKEHFEKGLVATPDDIELLQAFADLLAEEFDDEDRAVKLVLEALHYLELQQPPDEDRIAKLEKLLTKLDPKRRTLAAVHDEMAVAARAIVARYEAAGLPMMVMDVSWRLGMNLGLDDLFEDYERAVRASGKSLAIWELAYNERDLEGWNTQGPDGSFKAAGTFLDAAFGEYDGELHDYQFLTLDTVTSGDFSMEAKLRAERGEVDFAGFVFGQKGANSFHGLFYVPGRKQAREGTANSDYVDLMSSFGSGSTQIWRHVPVPEQRAKGGTSSGSWRTLRLDMSGTLVDLWLDGELLATHEFASREVLRGKFGLLTGRGKVRFKDVRYLARDGRDRSASIERELRMEAFQSANSGAVGISYQGVEPPWPKTEEWVQGGRVSWDEYGAVPQLLVFFSIQQNEIVPIDEWLLALGKKMEDLGLKIVCVASPNDQEALPAYLQTHPLPGDVAIDYRGDSTGGIGESFEEFFIDRVNLPRVLLLDVDQKVVWEGDPGVIMGSGLAEPFESYLDDPLVELLHKRKVKQLRTWLPRWEEEGQGALARGDFPAAAKLLAEAEELDERFYPEVARAKSQRAAVHAAVVAIEATARSLADAGAEPAIEVLLEWGASLDLVLDKSQRKKLKKVRASKHVKDWRSALKAADRFVTKTKLPLPERTETLLARLAELEGLFPKALERDLRAAAGDPELLQALAEAAPARPALWLAHTRFGW